VKTKTIALPVALFCGVAAALFAPVAANAAHTSHAGASAASGGTTDDILCLVFSMSSANSQDQKAQISGLVGMAYYLGRLDGAHTSADLQQKIDAAIASKKGQDLGALAHTCGQTLQGRMSGLAPINQHLAAEFGAKSPAPGPAAPATTLKPIPPVSH
jgi:hypothetical protein